MGLTDSNAVVMQISEAQADYQTRARQAMEKWRQQLPHGDLSESDRQVLKTHKAVLQCFILQIEKDTLRINKLLRRDRYEGIA